MPRAMVIGSPVSHSLSPVLHRAGFNSLGLQEWSYERREVDEASFASFMARLPADVLGLSITMPCKESALAFANGSSALAREVGGANTLYRVQDASTGTPRWQAENTDVAGVLHALQGAGLERASTATILGSGATARSCVVAAAQLGVTTMTFVVRAEARPETVRLAESYDMDVAAVDHATAGSAIQRADVTMSTLPGHAADAFAPSVELLELDGRYVFDVVYAHWPSLLAQAASDAGAVTVSGLEMLVEQAALQFELFTGHAAPIADMRAAGYAAMK